MDAHRPWRGELLERELPCWSSHAYPPGPVDSKRCREAWSYGDEMGSFHVSVKRLGAPSGAAGVEGFGRQCRDAFQATRTCVVFACGRPESMTGGVICSWRAGGISEHS